MAARARILVANGNDDILAALEDVLGTAGYEVRTAHVRELRRGDRDLHALFREFRPQVAIVDIGPPYDENWGFAKTLVADPVTGRIPFLWTTTNAHALTEFAGVLVDELLLKPYDLDHLLEKVRKALAEDGGAQLPPEAPEGQPAG